MVKKPPANAGYPKHTGSICELGRSPGVGNGNPLQYCCLENSMTEDPCRPETMGLQRVAQDLATKQQQRDFLTGWKSVVYREGVFQDCLGLWVSHEEQDNKLKCKPS